MLSGNNPISKILSIEHMQWEESKFKVAPRSFCVLAFRIRGDAVLSSGKDRFQLHSGDILYLPQNMGYTAKYSDTDTIVIHFVTQKDDERIRIFSPQNRELFHQLFSQAQKIWENKAPGYETFAMASLYTILGTLAEAEANSNLPRHFLNAVAYVNSHYTSSTITVDEVCAIAGIGATVFRQLFKKHYGKTPTEYVTNLRLEYARKLIAGGETVENAAYKSGFSDPKYFARVVKKYFGCTPRSFKTYGK